MQDEAQNDHREDENIVENRELSIWEALFPVIILVGMLAYNVYVFEDDALSGSNQFILLLGGAVAAIVGYFNKISYKQMMKEVAENVKSVSKVACLVAVKTKGIKTNWRLLSQR